MNRREFLKISMLAGAGFMASCSLPSNRKVAVNKPNIIFILTDDQGWADAAVYGHPYVKTPNIDRLASGGTRYTQFYVNATVCAPSRVALMTGQYPSRNNVHHIYLNPEFDREHGMPVFLDPNVLTVADVMKQAGYTTGHIGKWHLCGRENTSPTPDEYGFDYHSVTHDGGQSKVFRERFNSSKHPVTDSSHWIMDDGIEFIEKNKDGGKPFYLNLWTLVPHGPLLPTPEELAVYEKLQANPEDFDGWMKEYGERAKDFTSQMKIFCAALTSLDQGIGKLLDYLDKSGLAGNTLIVFTSDNGPEDYHTGDSSNAGVGYPGLSRGRKRSLYEGGIKVPCILRWPGKVPADKVSDAVWTGVDLLPTLAAVTGVKTADSFVSDGEDVSDIWFGSSRKRKKDIFWEWKFEVGGENDYHPPQLAIRSGDWKLFCNPDGNGVELYNIADDSSERKNIAANYPQVTQILKTKLLDWKKTIPEKYVYEKM